MKNGFNVVNTSNNTATPIATAEVDWYNLKLAKARDAKPISTAIPLYKTVFPADLNVSFVAKMRFLVYLILL